jgi:hypothetical protein
MLCIAFLAEQELPQLPRGNRRPGRTRDATVPDGTRMHSRGFGAVHGYDRGLYRKLNLMVPRS